VGSGRRLELHQHCAGGEQAWQDGHMKRPAARGINGKPADFEYVRIA
jgi:hypothetical protein